MSLLFALANLTIIIYYALASICSWVDWFESYFVRTPKDRFSCDETHLVLWCAYCIIYYVTVNNFSVIYFSQYFTDRSKAVLLLWIFYVFVLSCVGYVLCASVYMCFVVTCWERADLLALVCGVFCEFVTFPLVSWVRCGTWLYRFLIFATLLLLCLCAKYNFRCT